MHHPDQMPGGLYLVPSPLGNLGDLTFRAAEVLKAADLVLAEDTRRTVKLLNHLQAPRPLMSYREQNHRRVWPKIADVLGRGGRVALVTDAGSPAVSDPGAALTLAVRAAGFTVIPLPGPSAVTCALAASGFDADRFIFAGFLPARSRERREFLKPLAAHPWTLVFFETPHRLAESLADLAAVLGPRPALLAREMTKRHEELLALNLDELAAEAGRRPRQGEMTLVVKGFCGPGEKPDLDMDRLRELARTDPRPTKVLAAQLAGESGRGRGEVYQLLLEARRAETPDEG